MTLFVNLFSLKRRAHKEAKRRHHYSSRAVTGRAQTVRLAPSFVLEEGQRPFESADSGRAEEQRSIWRSALEIAYGKATVDLGARFTDQRCYCNPGTPAS